MQTGDGRDVPDDETVTDWQETKLPSLIDGYSLRDVSNADESALFYRVLPHRELAVCGDKC